MRSHPQAQSIGLCGRCSLNRLQHGHSDIEVDYIDLEKRTRLSVPGHPKDRTYPFGVIWSFAYKLDGGTDEEEIVVATTRPETMLGDVAVAVHPEDPRYTQFHGKYLVHPFVDRKIKVITDATLVDMSFGTGAVKVTPAHDPNDFATGRRHGLPEITIFTSEGTMADNCGHFSGLVRFEARQEVIKALKELKHFRGDADNKMRLGLCSRTKDVIEPMLKPQWWGDCSHMAKRAADSVRNGELKITPEEHKKTWFRWLDNIRDWCVSRQASLATLLSHPTRHPICHPSCHTLFVTLPIGHTLSVTPHFSHPIGHTPIGHIRFLPIVTCHFPRARHTASHP